MVSSKVPIISGDYLIQVDNARYVAREWFLPEWDHSHPVGCQAERECLLHTQWTGSYARRSALLRTIPIESQVFNQGSDLRASSRLVLLPPTLCRA